MSKSAEKLLELLRLVARSDQPLGVMDLARESGLDKSTVSRLMSTLAFDNLVQRDPDSRMYQSGVGLLALATSVRKRNRLLRLAEPILQALSKDSGETVSLYLLVGTGRVCVDGVEGGPGSVEVHPMGVPISLLQGSTSRVILAFQDEAFRKSVYAEAAWEADAAEAMERELASIRETGIYTSESARAPGMHITSAPLSRNGRVVGALSVTGREASIVGNAGFISGLLVDACKKLSLALSSGDFAYVGEWRVF